MAHASLLRSRRRTPTAGCASNEKLTCEAANFCVIHSSQIGVDFAYSLENMSKSAEASTATLRFIDFFSIARPNGDCVVLLVSHPGENQLAKYFPS